MNVCMYVCVRASGGSSNTSESFSHINSAVTGMHGLSLESPPRERVRDEVQATDTRAKVPLLSFVSSLAIPTICQLLLIRSKPSMRYVSNFKDSQLLTETVLLCGRAKSSQCFRQICKMCTKCSKHLA
jgi:hypothetical protein